MPLLELLGKERLIFDGSMGTLLQGKGLAAGELPELWNILQSEVIVEIHKAYVQAGCNILKTNTFGANRLKLSDAQYSVSETISAGVSLAKQAAGGTVSVALDIGPTGKLPLSAIWVLKRQ